MPHTAFLIHSKKRAINNLKLTTMHLQIEVFSPKAFTKNGKLKKKAAPEFGRTLFDAKPYYPETVPKFLEETATKLKKDYTGFESPYIFTHINATNQTTGEMVRIFETCNGLITSPTTLLKFLTY